MSIEKEYNKYKLHCDVCFEEVDEKFYDFQEAVDYKKANGWGSRKQKDVWFDVCPNCKKENKL